MGACKRIFWLIGPAALAILTSDTSAARSPHTGIAGRSFIPPICMAFPPYDCTDPTPVPTTITVLSETAEFITEIATDLDGNFAVNLKAGTYWLVPQVFTLTPPSLSLHVCRLSASPFQVMVEKKAIASVEVGYGYYCLD